jgi:hypothetical protein
VLDRASPILGGLRVTAIFVAIRLPFYILGVVILTAVCIPLGLGLACLFAVYWILILPPLWLTFAVPFRLVSSALSNDATGFSRFIQQSVTKWQREIADAPEALTEFSALYRNMTRWLLGTPKA